MNFYELLFTSIVFVLTQVNKGGAQDWATDYMKFSNILLIRLICSFALGIMFFFIPDKRLKNDIMSISKTSWIYMGIFLGKNQRFKSGNKRRFFFCNFFLYI